MNIISYYGNEILQYIAERYVQLHHKITDGYSVYDQQGQPLFGFVPSDEMAPIHKLIWIKH